MNIINFLESRKMVYETSRRYNTDPARQKELDTRIDELDDILRKLKEEFYGNKTD